MKYFSMFSGIGGFEYGVQQSETKSENSSNGKSGASQLLRRSFCVGFSEVDKYATQIYKKHFKHKEYGDVSKIDWNTVDKFELLVGGFPCQSFSIAGKRGGFNDTRGTLFFEIAKCLKQKQPRLFLLENVKGLLSHNKGQTFFTILTTLDELGYDLQWQVLNSKNFGVPQNRERVFIVGHLRGTSRPEVFPIGGSNSKALEQIISGGQGNRVYTTDGLSCTQASQAGGQGAKTGLYRQGTEIRRLTPTECERLQGFPDGWTEWGKVDCPWYPEKCITKTTCSNYTFCKGCDPYTGECRINKQIEQKISDTQRYKCLGNAVTTNVIKSIMKRIGGVKNE